jgi:hypothetical protein
MADALQRDSELATRMIVTGYRTPAQHRQGRSARDRALLDASDRPDLPAENSRPRSSAGTFLWQQNRK